MRNNYSIMLTLFLMSVFSLSVTADSSKSDASEISRLDDMTVVAEVRADEVWQLKESGQIMALEDLISQVRKDYPGRIIEIELDDEDGRYVYELELVDENGVVWDMEVDAGSGEVLKYEQDD